MKIHEKYMSRCIQLAKNGLGTTYPNPLVGSVIVHKNTVIGEGWHYKAGQPHAEVHAINNVVNTSLLSAATIYVSLEPCSHYGKTPPCADLIIEKGIKSVVIGTTDPNPKVAGNGIKKLISAGCDVTVGVMENACTALNKRFFTFQQKKRPYIILKWAQSADGFIAPVTRDEQKPVWITNTFSRQRAHQLRAAEQAILVGTQTVLDDNPSLTTRDWYGSSPVRMVLDRSLKISSGAAVCNEDATTLILTEKVAKDTENVHFKTIDFDKNVAQQICDLAYAAGLQSIIIEGGRKTLQTFIDANLWDEGYVFTGTSKFKRGTTAPSISGILTSKSTLLSDTLIQYKNKSV